MKHIYIIILLILFFSCGNITPKHKFEIIYEFEHPENVSTNDQQGTIETLNRRLDKLASNYVVELNSKQQIEVKLSTNFELNRLNAILTNPGRLDFWEVVKPQDLRAFFSEANELVKRDNDSINPIFDLIQPDTYGHGLFSIAVKDTSQMQKYLNKKAVRQLLPASLKRSKFLFGIPNEEGLLPLYLVKTTPEGIGFVNETHIVSARTSYDQLDRPSVTVQMNQQGAMRWERMTGIAYDNQSQIAITLNDIVYSAPTASFGPILGGNTEVSGGFSEEQAQQIELILSAHKRIPKLKFVNSSAITD